MLTSVALPPTNLRSTFQFSLAQCPYRQQGLCCESAVCASIGQVLPLHICVSAASFSTLLPGPDTLCDGHSIIKTELSDNALSNLLRYICAGCWEEAQRKDALFGDACTLLGKVTPASGQQTAHCRFVKLNVKTQVTVEV